MTLYVVFFSLEFRLKLSSTWEPIILLNLITPCSILSLKECQKIYDLAANVAVTTTEWFWCVLLCIYFLDLFLNICSLGQIVISLKWKYYLLISSSILISKCTLFSSISLRFIVFKGCAYFCFLIFNLDIKQPYILSVNISLLTFFFYFYLVLYRIFLSPFPCRCFYHNFQIYSVFIVWHVL